MRLILEDHSVMLLPPDDYQWSAHDEDNDLGPIGWGPTRCAAVADYLSELSDDDLREHHYNMAKWGEDSAWLPQVEAEIVKRWCEQR